MSKWFRKLMCRIGCHKYAKDYTFEVSGFAVLSWGGDVTRGYQKLFTCEHCGHVKVDGGYMLASDKQRHPEFYNERRWPIDSFGNELPTNH